MATDVGTLQSKLTLDFSQFASGMNSAISMVRKFGQQLKQALGSASTQGFSTTNQAVNNLQQSIVELQASAATFSATMNNVNTTLQQFSNVQNNTSRLRQNMQGASRATQTLNSNAREASNQIRGIGTNTNKAANNANKLSNNLRQSKNWATEIQRIIGGIVVSQSFYRLTGIMRDLVNSSIEFMTNMEQSAISFKYLLGSAESASGFLQALQDFAVSSPMDMKGAEAAARMLMTMGFQAENTISVLRVLTDAATVAGGEMSDTVNRIALALGQMLQSGTVKMQEVRQLINANIPILEILQTELGLTAQQVANIGKESIDSGKAVTAILVGLQKRFGGASLEMQQTVSGALSAIKDSFYILFNEVMSGPYEAFRQKLVSLSNAMQQLAQIARQHGAGGVFEALVPERLQMVLRNVIGAFMQLGRAIQYFGLIIKEVFGGMAEIMAQILNIILPPIAILLNGIMQFVYGLLQAYPIVKYFIAALALLAIAKPIGMILMWFWKVMSLGGIVLKIASYIRTLIKWMAALVIVMINNPIIAVIAAIIVAVGLLTGAFQKAINKIKEFFSLLGAKMTSANKTVNKKTGLGYNPNDILKPVDKDTKKTADKYNKSLTNIGDSLDKVGDKADKAKKKLKQAFNQSFDEIYGINTDTATDLGVGGLNDIDLSDALADLGDLNDALGDLSAFNFDDAWANNFMDSWGNMWETIKKRIKSFGLAALLAGLLTGILTGNPWIGFAAALAALFWPEISRALGLTKTQGSKVLGAALGALIGAVIAKVTGAGLLKGALWAGIGALIFAGLWPAIQKYMETGDWRKSLKALDFTLFGAGIGALIGNLIGGPIGAAIGGLIGAALGNGLEGGIDAWVNGGTWQQIVQGINWTTTGTGIGALIGTLICPGIGTAVGAAIGFALGDGIEGAIKAWANNENGWQIADAANWTEIGTGLGTSIGLLLGGPLGAAAGAAIGLGIGSIVDNIVACFAAIDGDWDVAIDAFKLWGQDIGQAFLDGLFGDGGIFGWSTEIFKFAGEFFDDISDAFDQGDWLRIGKDILLGIMNGLLGAITFIFEPIARLFQAIVKAICTVFGIHSPAETMKPIGENILKGLLEGIVGFIKGIPGYIGKVGGALIASMGSWFTGIGQKVTTWLSDAKTSIGTFVSTTATSISSWATDRISDFTTWASNTKTKVSTWATETGENISNWVTNTKENISTWSSETKEKVSTWVGDTKEKLSTWITDTKTKFTTWTSDTKTKISTWVTDTKTKVSTWSDETKNKIGTWVTDTKTKISTWATNTKSSVSSWYTDTKSKISSWAGETSGKISGWWTNVKSKFDSFKKVSFTDWCNSTFKTISNWCNNLWKSIKDKIGKAIDKVKEFLGLSSKDANVRVSANVGGNKNGHATGGVFNREHWARFAEGNKAEAIIPLENRTAMQPFVDAVSDGLTATLAPMMATMNNGGNSNNLQPLYVGTLVADERGLKELERKMQIIRVKEGMR